MLARIAHTTVRRRRPILVLAAVLFVFSGAIGGGVAQQLSSGGFEDPSAESTRAEHYLIDHFDGAGTPNIILLVTVDPGSTVDDPAAASAGQSLTAELQAEGKMAYVASYWSLGSPPPLKTANGSRALVFARYDGDQNELNDLMGTLGPKYTRHDGGIAVAVGGFGQVFREVGDTIESDLLRAESIALPITLLLLLLVFGSVVAAALPLAIGALSVVGTFLVLLLINQVTEVSVFALNMTTAMGLGLAIDYSLFIVSRFREELSAGHSPEAAVVRTVRTAGRTVAFSALTVAASLCALLVFPLAFLRSFAYAGVAVALLAGIYAVVVLPAILAVLGHRINKLTLWKRSTHPADEGFWHAMAIRVMRRPLPFATSAIVLLLLLGSPFLHIRLGLPDDRVLPASTPSRVVSDIIREEFTSEEAGALSVVAAGIGDPAARSSDIDTYAKRLAAVPGVSRVDALTGTYCGRGLADEVGCMVGQAVLGGGDLAHARFLGDDATYLNVVPTVEPLSAAGEALVREIRRTDAPFETKVGGQSAMLVDSKSSLFSKLPLALGIIAAITFALLFMMFGSIVVPVKAVILNLLSLSATFGAMVWIFQDGRLSGRLGFTPTGFLDATTPILMFCVAFGLSMDYEVFLLSRIKEEHDRGRDNVSSVAVGLERTGRIVTAAALLISVVFISFATSHVSFIKLFGIGLTLAVLMDAFVIRGMLVPAFMRLAGDANWWAPGPLRRFHDRFGVSEHVDLDDESDSDSGGPSGSPPAPTDDEPTRVAAPAGTLVGAGLRMLSGAIALVLLAGIVAALMA
jgi:RND superfamily putative drug exporter